MEKMYVILRPRDFWRFGSVNYEGEYPRENIKDFEVDDKFNYLIFELDYKMGEVKEFNKARLLLANDKDYDFDVNYNASNNSIDLSNDYLGMYTIFSNKLDKIEIKPSKASGMLRELQEDSDNLFMYKASLDNLLDVCRSFKEEHDKTVNGPSKGLIKDILKSYKHSIKHNNDIDL